MPNSILQLLDECRANLHAAEEKNSLQAVQLAESGHLIGVFRSELATANHEAVHARQHVQYLTQLIAVEKGAADSAREHVTAIERTASEHISALRTETSKAELKSIVAQLEVDHQQQIINDLRDEVARLSLVGRTWAFLVADTDHR
jgi:hypothetical protein